MFLQILWRRLGLQFDGNYDSGGKLINKESSNFEKQKHLVARRCKISSKEEKRQ